MSSSSEENRSQGRCTAQEPGSHPGPHLARQWDSLRIVMIQGGWRKRKASGPGSLFCSQFSHACLIYHPGHLSSFSAVAYSQQQQPGKEEENTFQSLSGEELLLTGASSARAPGSAPRTRGRSPTAQIRSPEINLIRGDSSSAQMITVLSLGSSERGSANCGNPIDFS